MWVGESVRCGIGGVSGFSFTLSYPSTHSRALQLTQRSAVIRVRMPDGTQLQGEFGTREPIGAVREFVAGVGPGIYCLPHHRID